MGKPKKKKRNKYIEAVKIGAAVMARQTFGRNTIIPNKKKLQDRKICRKRVDRDSE